MKIGEHFNQELKNALRKKISLWPNGFPLAEEKISSVQELCFQHSGEAKKIKLEPECLILI